MKLLVTLILAFQFSITLAQTEGSILTISDSDGKISLDGVENGSIFANKPYKILTSPGDHYLQVITGATEKNEVISVESGKQKVVKFSFSATGVVSSEIPFKLIADLNFSIPGSLIVASWQQNNPGKTYEYPTFYYAFDKGDEIQIDLVMTNKNGTNILLINSYPGNVPLYSNKTLTEAKDLRLKISERGIYKFTIGTNHVFDRNGLLKIKRKPSNTESNSFNTNVVKKPILKTVVVQEVINNYVNSGMNATFKGGKSRILIPISLPENTIEWYYKFSATREPSEIQQTQQSFKLFAELTSLALKATGVGFIAGKATGIASEQLSQPPGSNVCDIFLLDYQNISAFETKNDSNLKYILQGTRQNVKSGNVKIDCCNNGQWYLGIRNPDTSYGIHTLIEVTAITMVEDWLMEGN